MFGFPKNQITHLEAPREMWVPNRWIHICVNHCRCEDAVPFILGYDHDKAQPLWELLKVRIGEQGGDSGQNFVKSLKKGMKLHKLMSRSLSLMNPW